MFFDRRNHQLALCEFEDGAVVFDGRTGDTHSLSAPIAEALKQFMCASVEEIEATRATMDTAALAQLDSLGLFGSDRVRL